ncbi:RDD family protein [Roseateles chitosanitabidus]|uniref:RDD family protein n=1 Tax=Roseateles chitosanitabidus TaxID=65048 RepID=UPI0008349115|nr:RDD family protein [Roseateles chitosanitabidus]
MTAPADPSTSPTPLPASPGADPMSPLPAAAAPAAGSAIAPASAATTVANATAAAAAAGTRLIGKLGRKPAEGDLHGDPRDWITPEDLNVAPGLLGLPLASPFQRAKAMMVDLVLLLALSHFGNTVLLGGCWWVAWRWYKLQRVSRGEVVHLGGGRLGWLPALCLVGFGLFTSVGDLTKEAKDKPGRKERAAAETALAVAGAASGADPTTAAAIQAALERHAEEADKAGKDDLDDEEVADIVKHAIRTARGEMASASAAALATPDAAASAAITEAQARAEDAEGRLKTQKLRNKQLERQVRDLREEARRTPLERMKHWWELVGLNLAWAFSWFVLWPLIWPGQTPGKKLMGLKIVELTGKPMKPMRCVRRYGGYAAGMATGGMGFLQILWDGNRQGLHDKAAHTAVIDLGNPRRLKLREDLTG